MQPRQPAGCCVQVGSAAVLQTSLHAHDGQQRRVHRMLSASFRQTSDIKPDTAPMLDTCPPSRCSGSLPCRSIGAELSMDAQVNDDAAFSQCCMGGESWVSCEMQRYCSVYKAVISTDMVHSVLRRLGCSKGQLLHVISVRNAERERKWLTGRPRRRWAMRSAGRTAASLPGCCPPTPRRTCWSAAATPQGPLSAAAGSHTTSSRRQAQARRGFGLACFQQLHWMLYEPHIAADMTDSMSRWTELL